MKTFPTKAQAFFGRSWGNRAASTNLTVLVEQNIRKVAGSKGNHEGIGIGLVVRVRTHTHDNAVVGGQAWGLEPGPVLWPLVAAA